MDYYKFSTEELRTICKDHIESLEKWARIMIHQILTEAWGKDYLHKTLPDNNYIIKKEIVERVDSMMNNDTSRYSTFVDAMFFDDIKYILCRQDLYNDHFSSYIKVMYPEGMEELRTFLNRLLPIRNKLCHDNPISIREAEQCVCYCNDFIDCVKEYYKMKGQNNDFNIPTIIRVNDSLGNEYIIKNVFASEKVTIIDPSTNEKKVFYLGDKFSLYLTLDPSFPEGTYSIKWYEMEGVEIVNNGKQINVTITNKLIGETRYLFCKLITNNEWHRWSGYDQQLVVQFKAIPLK